MSFERLTFAIGDAGIGHLELACPERSNVLDSAAARELDQVAEICAGTPDLKCLLISGAGKRFTVGGDIDMLSDAGEDLPARLRPDIETLHQALARFHDLPVPIVAEVRGAAAGGGLGLVYIADLAYATPGTRFATGFIELGLTGDGGGTWFLPRLVGLRRALEIYLTNRVLDAEEAKALGIVTDVVDEAKIRDHCLATARTLAGRPGPVIRSMRRLLSAATETPYAEHLRREVDAMCAAAETPETQAAIRSVAAKMRR